MTVTSLLLFMIPLVLLLAVAATIGRRGQELASGRQRWAALAALVAGSCGGALLVTAVRDGGIGSADWRSAALIALGALAGGLLVIAVASRQVHPRA